MGTSPADLDTLINLPYGRDEKVIQTLDDNTNAAGTPESFTDNNDHRISRVNSNNKRGPLTFTREPIVPLEEANKPVLSGLSMVLSESSSGDSLTIYLPNRDTLNMAVNSSLKIVDIIKKILSIHAKENILPPLDYQRPHIYRLRMHDADGEPDEDFKPFDSNLYLRDYGVQLNEYCLWTDVQQRPEDSLKSGDNSYRRSLSIGRQSDVTQQQDGSVTVELAGHSAAFKLSCLSEGARVGDLLPLLASLERLNMYTDKYVFTVNERDQSRLMVAALYLCCLYRHLCIEQL